MADDADTWVLFTILGMATLVVGLLLLDESAWYVQYPVLAAALLLSLLGVGQASTERASA